MKMSPLAEVTDDDYQRLVAVNLTGAFNGMREGARRVRDGGRIINVSSGLTRFSFPGSSAYASMKGAVEVLTRGGDGAGGEAVVSDELDGVRVHRIREPERPRDLEEFIGWVDGMNDDMIAAGEELIESGRFDLVHGHDWLVARASAALARGGAIPFVTTIHATEHGRHHGCDGRERKCTPTLRRRKRVENDRLLVRLQTAAEKSALAGDTPANPGPRATLSGATDPAAVKTAVKKVADWELARMQGKYSQDWTIAIFGARRVAVAWNRNHQPHRASRSYPCHRTSMLWRGAAGLSACDPWL